MPIDKAGSMILTTVTGEARVIKGWLHQFGVLHPFSLALAALVLGNLAGVFLHI